MQSNVVASRAFQIPHTIAPIPPDFCVAFSWKVFSAMEDGGLELWLSITPASSSFYRVPAMCTRLDEGAGLGASRCILIAERHHTCMPLKAPRAAVSCPTSYDRNRKV